MKFAKAFKSRATRSTFMPLSRAILLPRLYPLFLFLQCSVCALVFACHASNCDDRPDVSGIKLYTQMSK